MITTIGLTIQAVAFLAMILLTMYVSHLDYEDLDQLKWVDGGGIACLLLVFIGFVLTIIGTSITPAP